MRAPDPDGAAPPPRGPRDPLAALLAGRFPDPATGELLGTSVRSVVIADSLQDREAELVAELQFGPRLAVIGDDDTFAALGDRVVRALTARFTVQRISLGRRPHADQPTLERLLAAVDQRTDAVVAVGTGTLNDLAKLIAKARACPQVVFATAPSMNGFTSVSASILQDGLKRSIRAEAPVGVFFDLSVLAAAPPRLIRAGLGDSLCRGTAQADWLLAHLLLDKPYREAPFAMLAADEEVLVTQSRALLGGDLDTLRSLARTLVLSGFGMTLCGGSYPASQGEHLLAHYAEMMQFSSTESYHGEQIGVATLAMARLQHQLLAQERAPELRVPELSLAQVCDHFGAELGPRCWHESQAKAFSPAVVEELNHRLAQRWPQLRAQLHAVTRPPPQLERALLAAGAPVYASELGWGADRFAQALRHARAIRDRYTFLDLACDSGVDPAAAALG
jgi:glycerol-1-phosphate dehydrogenase [NAD(P)+]